MKRIKYRFKHYFLCLCLIGAVISAYPVSALCEITVKDVYPVDVTPSGFSVVWRTSESATPEIKLYADSNGSTDITNHFEITPFPLTGGNPDLSGEHEQEIYKMKIRYWMAFRGIMHVRVEGLAPSTTYYFKVTSTGFSKTVTWPQEGTSSITTPDETSFAGEARQILITLDEQNTQGFVVMARADNTPYGVSAIVSDGAPQGKAVINLANLYGTAGTNWQPSGDQAITLTVLGKWDSSLTQSLNLSFTQNFSVASLPDSFHSPLNNAVLPGDVNDDGFLDMRDAILIVQFIARINPSLVLYLSGDVNSDDMLGIVDAVFILQSISGDR